jgi:hypothetical protein
MMPPQYKSEASDSTPPLARRLEKIPLTEGEPDREAILSEFLSFVSDDLGLELYPAQEEAILELLDWKHVVLATPTGSGKSLVAMALCFQALAEGRVAYYTCPIKALVNEKFFDLCDTFGPARVGLLTGDASVNPGAPIICCTAEILSNRTLRDPSFVVDYVVMDEFHYYGDKERGAAWHVPLVCMKDSLFLMMSATLGDTSAIADSLLEYTERKVARVEHGDRPVPLSFSYRETPIHETIQELVDTGEAPVYLVSFTQRGAAEDAQALTSLSLSTKEARAQIAQIIGEFRFDSPYGKDMSRFLRAGIGVHHAGLLPKYRLLVEKLAQKGLLQVICGTDSLGVGVNVPIRTVVLSALSKYDGEKIRLLSAREFHQIAGRAGRRGFDDHGNVVVQAPEHVVENRRIEAKLAKTPHLKNKLRRKTAPPGFVGWDKNVFNRLLHSPPEPLEPVLEINHGMLVHALQGGDGENDGYKRVVEVIRRSHLPPNQKSKARIRAAQLLRSLVRAELVDLVPRALGPGKFMRVRDGLQEAFSLNQALSLFLVEALDVLDPQAEDYALDVLTLVESVLEDPMPVLFRQKDKIKGELVARLKAEGVEYEERMAALEKVEHPKPKAEMIYETFNAFALHHPWVGTENIKPKAVARELYELCLGFGDYVRHLGLARSEGVLLRYLSQSFKTLVQNVPDEFKDERVEDIASFLSTAVRRTDSSLLDEWENMLAGEALPRRPGDEEVSRPKQVDLLADRKGLFARLRHELYLLLRALADRCYEDALDAMRLTEEHHWDVLSLAGAFEPFFEEHRGVDLSFRARQPDKTVIREVGNRRFEVLHRILDLDGEEDAGLECVVDLSGPLAEPDLPLLELRRIAL